MQEMQELLEEWQAEGPPLDVRLKSVHSFFLPLLQADLSTY